MSSRRIPLAFGASLTALATAAVTTGAAAAAPARHYGHTPRIVNDCTRSRVEPSRIILRCGDASQDVIRIHWSSWGSTAAKGAGVFIYNDCDPNCAAGHWHRQPATLRAYRVRRHPLGRLFTRLLVTTASGKQVYRLPTSGE